MRWSGIQQALEENVADTLILMDAAYYPSSAMATKAGVLELIAAATSQEHMADVGRCTFTHILAEQLRARATQGRPLTAAELHSSLLSRYAKVVQDRHPEREIIVSFPSPLHLQTSRNPRLPSVLLAPLPHGVNGGMANGSGNNIGHGNGNTNGAAINGSSGAVGLPSASPPGPMVCLNVAIPENALELDNWIEWLRAMPDGARDVSLDRAYPGY